MISIRFNADYKLNGAGFRRRERSFHILGKIVPKSGKTLPHFAV
jgi:hypothetical protein